MLKPLATGLEGVNREDLFTALLFAAAAQEEERLRLVRQLLLSAPPLARPTKLPAGSKTGPALGRDTEVVRRIVFPEQSRLGHCEGLVGVLLEVWEEMAPERIVTLLEELPASVRKEAGCKMLLAGVMEPLQLEQALEHIYLMEEEEVIGDPTRATELAMRRRQSSIARNLLRNGKVPRLTATLERLCPLAPEDDPLHDHRGGLRLTCECARMWMMPSHLLAKAQGGRLKAYSYPPLPSPASSLLSL